MCMRASVYDKGMEKERSICQGTVCTNKNIRVT